MSYTFIMNAYKWFRRHQLDLADKHFGEIVLLTPFLFTWKPLCFLKSESQAMEYSKNLKLKKYAIYPCVYDIFRYNQEKEVEIVEDNKEWWRDLPFQQIARDLSTFNGGSWK